jgi:cobalamin biosynthesis Mg chelatase CobN
LVIDHPQPQPVSPRYSRLFALVVAACASLAVFATPAPAATPCWKLLLNDWYDGTISNIYPIPCYHQAIAHLPTDIKVYSSAADDINRALQAAIARQKKTHTTVTAVETGAATTQKTKTSSHATTPTTTTPTTTTPTTTKKNGPVKQVLKDITPGGADSFPLPLLILGILAIVLVLAGVGGMLWRRYQGGGGGT